MEDVSKIAVFFDAENVSSEKVPFILDSLSQKGEILFQRAYADWSEQSTKPWKDQINKTPITAIHQFHHNEKQAVDKLIMMDAIEMAIKHQEINIFAIVASDNGYYSLALRLRELGKKVIGIGEKSKCNPIWIKACNEFSYIDDLAESDENILLNEQGQDKTLKNYALEKFLEQAYKLTPLYKETNTVLLSRFWESILRLKSDFNVYNYGAKSPRELIQNMNHLFQLSDDGKPQKTFFVELIEHKEDSNRKDGVIKRRIQNYRIIRADDGSGDYFFYMGEINPEYKDNILDKETRVNFQVVEAPGESQDHNNNNGRATDVIVL